MTDDWFGAERASMFLALEEACEQMEKRTREGASELQLCCPTLDMCAYA